MLFRRMTKGIAHRVRSYKKGGLFEAP